MLQSNKVGNELHVGFEPGSKLNMSQANNVKAEFAKLVQGNGGKMLLDMRNLDYVDSSGVGALLSLLRNCREHKWELKLVNLQPAVKDLFSLLQLHTIFTIG